MYIYILCSLLPLIIGLSIADLNFSKRKRAVYLVVTFSVLALILGFRDLSVGSDTPAYSEFFLRIVSSDNYIHIVKCAPVYNTINKIIGMLFPAPQALLLFEAVLTCSATSYFIFTFSKRVEISSFLFVALYFYENSFNGMRQMAAAALCLAAIAALYRKHYAIGVVFYFCALGTHLVCLVMLPFLPLCMVSLSFKNFKLLLIGEVILVAWIVVSFDLLLNLTLKIFPAYQGYLALVHSSRYITQGRNVIQSLFFLVLVLIDCSQLLRKSEEKAIIDRENAIMSALALFGVLWAIAFFWNAFLGPRISWFPTLALVVLIPNRFAASPASVPQQYTLLARLVTKKLTIKEVRLAVIILVCFILQLIQLMGNYSDVIPYIPFWCGK